MRYRILVALAATVLLAASATTTLADPVDDALGVEYPQVHGEMVVGIPDTEACTATLAKDVLFRRSAYGGPGGSALPHRGTYTPTCEGPWSKVVLTMSAYVNNGVQFDRICDVQVGGVHLLHCTTPEGAYGWTSWSIQRDVTQYAHLFESPQPLYFQIANEVDGTYTGLFYGTLQLTFYGTSKQHPAADTPELVLPVNDRLVKADGTDNPWLRGLNNGQERLTEDEVFPANLTRLTAEVFTSGHGGCEEDWWYDPFLCEGTPYREAAVYVDGRLAGIAPIYPTLYTGGWGPDYWRPIPGPRTLNMRPYELDLTPFVGTLTDGLPHSVSVGILNWTVQPGDYWPTTANLLGWTNDKSEERTTGAVTAYSAPATPTTTGFNSFDASTNVGDASHALSITGWTEAPGIGRVTTTVASQVKQDAKVLAALVKHDWTWVSTVTTDASNSPNEHANPHAKKERLTVDTTTSRYGLARTGAHWGFVDAFDRVVTLNDKETFRSRLSDHMQTGAAVVGITGIVGGAVESWRYEDSTLGCVSHELVGMPLKVLVDRVGTDCPVV